MRRRYSVGPSLASALALHPFGLPKPIHLSRCSIRRWSLHRSLRRRYHRYMQPPKNHKSDDPSSEPPMASALETLLSYLRIPVLASSGLAAILSGLLYFKQKYDSPLPRERAETTCAI